MPRLFRFSIDSETARGISIAVPNRVRLRSTLFDRPANADKKAAGIADGELIRAPRLCVRGTVFDDQLPDRICHRVYVFDVKVQAEGIVLDIFRPSLRIGQMEVPASAVLENPIMTIVTDDREF